MTTVLKAGKTYNVELPFETLQAVYVGEVHNGDKRSHLFECIDGDGDVAGVSVPKHGVEDNSINQIKTLKDHKKSFVVGQTYIVKGQEAVYIGKSHLHEEYPHYFETDELLYFIPESDCDEDVKERSVAGKQQDRQNGMLDSMWLAFGGKPTVEQIFALYEELSTKDKTRFGIMALEDSMKD